MSNDQVEAASAVIQAAASVFTMLIVIRVSRRLMRYTKRKDRLHVHLKRWFVQQEINLQTISNSELLIAFEKFIYGDDAIIDIESARIRYVCFLLLNRIQENWFAYREEILTLEQFREFSLPTVKIMVRQRALVEYCLKHRGYHPELAKEIMPLFDAAVAPALPNASSTAGAPRG